MYLKLDPSENVCIISIDIDRDREPIADQIPRIHAPHQKTNDRHHAHNAKAARRDHQPASSAV